MMYFALMSHARSRGCTRFDFGRSKVGTGAAAFKKNWGFEPEPLSYAVRTADGQPPRDINPLSPRYRLQVALWRSEEHTSELQSLMRISYAVFCLKKKTTYK